MSKFVVTINTSESDYEQTQWAEWILYALRYSTSFIFPGVKVEPMLYPPQVEKRKTERRVKGGWATRNAEHGRRYQVDRRRGYPSWDRTYGPGWERPWNFRTPVRPVYWNYGCNQGGIIYV